MVSRASLRSGLGGGRIRRLVLGGGGLFAVFPLAYAVVMPAIYIPVITMLLALVFRGVAFEYRWRTVRGRWVWDWAFHGGSTLAALCQGIALGALVQGLRQFMEFLGA